MKTLTKLLGVGLLSLTSSIYSQDVGRVEEIEDFKGSSARSFQVYPKEDESRWKIDEEYLKCDDRNKASGSYRFYFADKIYDKSSEYNIKTKIDKSAWGSDVDMAGLIFSGDKDSEHCYTFLINVAYQNYWIAEHNQGFSHAFKFGNSDAINQNISNILEVKVTLDGSSYLINDRVVENLGLIPREGNVGIYIWDSMGNEDPDFTSTTYIDYLNITSNITPNGGGAGYGLFIRSDVNQDEQIDLADPINILNYCFTGSENIRCVDSMDVNDDGGVDISDAIYEILYLYSIDNISIPKPFPEYDVDPTPDNLFCE